ncbi:unnamed protein product [Brachionus calyciflorus]|uniref:Peptidase S1 domain-containing protein n=1 Tax=Brachionus calyciflorus TaxID=104777 RepID=A0A813LYY1_9BILA|nr:unnamed protein product [Brachionus calyciflorus]
MKILKLFTFLMIDFILAIEQWDDYTRVNAPYCGIKSENDKKIVGGEEANRGEWPWQIAIYFRNRFICGGSLINSMWILTAAHCVYKQNSNSYAIVTGLHDLDNRDIYTQTRQISQIIVHPSYSQIGFKNDIALMRLSQKVILNNQTLPVCLPLPYKYYSNVKSTATGWGSIRSGGPVSKILNEVELPLLNDIDCLKLYPTVTPSIALCAGNTGLNKDTCQGDSGGPLVVEETNMIGKSLMKKEKHFFLAGITSWGDGCGNGGVYTRTSNYYDWIKQNIRQTF